uniref:Transposase n=1 Tax=Ascaris lumbricoides TaxID=6252 RepID=A0A0M3IBG2_ASCLU
MSPVARLLKAFHGMLVEWAMPYCPWLAASDGAMFDAARRYRHDANLIRTIIYSSNDDEMRLPQRSTRIRGQYEN